MFDQMLASGWMWDTAAKWMEALWRAVKGAADAVYDAVYDWIWSWAQEWVSEWATSGRGAEMTSALGTAWETILAGMGQVNLWFPLDVACIAIGGYYAFVMGWTFYRLVKSWIPFVSG